MYFLSWKFLNNCEDILVKSLSDFAKIKINFCKNICKNFKEIIRKFWENYEELRRKFLENFLQTSEKF